jgi:hypothetical protein
MVKTKNLKTLDNVTFEWIEKQKMLKSDKTKLAGENAIKESAKSRSRYFQIRNVARKEIADLVKLAKTLPEDQFTQIFNLDRLKPQPYPEGKTKDEVQKKLNEILKGPGPVDDLAELVFALLRDPLFAKADPDVNRAEIAKLFIETGFNYLSKKSYNVTLSHERTIKEAIDLANYLAESFKDEDERRYSRPMDGKRGYG